MGWLLSMYTHLLYVRRASFVLLSLDHRGIQPGLAAQHVHTSVVCAQGQLTTGTVVCAQVQLPTLLYVHRASYQRDCCMRTGPVTNRDCCMCTGPVTNRDTQALVACCCFNKGNITGSMTLPSNVVEIGSSAPIQVSLGVVCDKLKPIYRQQLRREPVVNVGGGDVQ